MVGRSPYLQSVWVEGPAELKGRIAPVRIDASARNSLAGTLVGGERSRPGRSETAGASEAA
jgi:tRNA-2-methylthio-N6-dimethylallyladenosine synthase